jgi:hypothetical protein
MEKSSSPNQPTEMSRFNLFARIGAIAVLIGALLAVFFVCSLERTTSSKIGDFLAIRSLNAAVDVPKFSLPSGTYSGPISIELTSDSPDAVIRYTTNGSKPTVSSPAYTDPIVLNASSVVMARLFVSGLADSPTAYETFLILGSDVLAFDSNLPIVVIDTLGSTVDQNSFTPAISGFIDTDYRGRAEITDPIDLACLSGLRIRGSTSTIFPKKQYAFEVWDENNEDKSVSILGMPDESDWILYAPYSDKSLLRNYLSYTWNSAIGRWAPRMKFVEVFYNADGNSVTSADYAGVYIFMEKIKRDVGRIDIAELGPSDISEPDISGGYILKIDRPDPGDNGFLTNIGLSIEYFEPKEDEITSKQTAWIQSYINEMETSLINPDFTDSETGYADYIDVDSFIDYHIIVEMTRNIDGFRASTFLYKDRSGKLIAGPAWDFNISLGNANYWDGQYTEGWYHDHPGLSPVEQDTTDNLQAGLSYPYYEWYRLMFDDPEFEMRYWARWFELRKDRFSTNRLMAEIDQYVELLDEAQKRNFQRWPILGRYIWPNDFIGDTYQEEIVYLKTWLTNRLAWIDSQSPI